MSSKNLKSKKMNILVVDDEDKVRNQLTTALVDIGHRVDIATSGEEAIDKFKSDTYRIALVDMVMPGLQCLELLKALKDINPDTCIIVLTQNINVKNAVQAMKLGAYDYITKPWDLDEIVVTVERAIERCELISELQEKSHYKNMLISKSINDLSSSDETVRRMAAEDLGDIGNEEAIDALLELFSDDSIAVQEAAEDALIKIGGEEAIQKIIPMLQSNQANLRNFATEMLENLGVKAVPTLSDLLKNADHDVRKFAVDVLGIVGCDEGVKPLIAALDDPHVNVSSGAAEALGNIGNVECVDHLIKKLSGDPWLVYAVIESLGKIADKKAVAPLINLAHEDDPVLLSSKIRALGLIGDTKACGFLFSLFEDEDNFLEGQIVEALEQIWEKSGENIFKDVDQGKVIKLLIPMLKEEIDQELRLSVINMIGRMKCNEAVSELLTCVSDENEDIREAAYRAIVQADISDDFINVLLSNLQNGEEQLQQVVIKIFGEIKCKEAGNTIADLMVKHVNSAIREEAANTLGKLDNKEEYAQNLINVLKDKSIDVQKAAICSLGLIKDVRAIDHMEALLGDKNLSETATNALISIGGERQLNSMSSLLKDSNPLCRSAAITIIGEIQTEDITGQLKDAMNDQNVYVRKAAIDVIAKIENSSFIEDLATSLHDEDKYVRIAATNALTKFNDPQVIDHLIAVVHAQDERIRYKAVQGLMKFKDEKVVYALISLLEDESNMVRIIALEALGETGDKEAICHIENVLETSNDDDILEAANNSLEKLYNQD